MQIKRQPKTTVKTEPYVARMYLEKFWKCPAKERQQILSDIDKYDVTEDDYTDDLEIELTISDERSKHLPSTMK